MAKKQHIMAAPVPMRRRSNVFLYLLIAVPICLMIIPTVIVLAVALLPTGVAFIIERARGYYGGLCVGAMNMAGAAPYLSKMWFQNHTVEGSLDIITDVFAYLVIYGCAAFGWALYSTTPSLVSAFMAMTAGRRVTTMRAQQKELVQKWGPDVESVYEPENKAGAAAATASPTGSLFR